MDVHEYLLNNGMTDHISINGKALTDIIQGYARIEIKERQLAESHIGNVSGQVCAECKRKDEIIKWNRFYRDLNDNGNCTLCDGRVECEDCKIYKDLLKQHKLDAAQN
jgi:hypothetical protein